MRSPAPIASWTAVGILAPRECGSRASSASLAPATWTVTRSRSTLAGYGELVHPARAEQVVDLHGPREATEQHRRTFALGAQQQRLPGVGVGRPRLRVEVVPVVPEHDQAQVAHRRERRGTGAHDDAAGAPRDREEVAVAASRARLGGQADVLLLPQHRRQGPVDADHVLGVRHAHQHASTRSGVRRRGDVGEQHRPVRARGRAPGRTRGLSPGQPAQEGVGLRVLGPGGRGRLRVVPPGLRPRHGGGALGGGVPGRYGEAQHVAAGAGVPGGDVSGQRGDRGTEHRLRADDAAHRGEPSGVAGLGLPREQVAADLLAREPHLDPAARHGVVRHRGRHQVVEGAVEVRQRQVHEDPGHRVDRGRLDDLAGLCRPRPRGPGAGLPHGLAQPRQGLRLVARVGHGACLPAADPTPVRHAPARWEDPEDG